MTGISFILSDQIDPNAALRLHDGLRAHNEQFTRPYDARDLMVVARDAEGGLLGGLAGYTNWEWLFVDHLWVHANARRLRLGTRLMDAAEEEAVRRGCRWSRLYTYDFQAPDFYAKRGYEVWATLEGYPPGHAQIWMRKALVQAA